tara:strand:- start:618 stop:821 length:204 start_codon:yes stop_codon:yes gene_type:complete
MDIDKIKDMYRDQWIAYTYGCGCVHNTAVADILLLEIEPSWGCTQCDKPGINGSDYVEDIKVVDCDT